MMQWYMTNKVYHLVSSENNYTFSKISCSVLYFDGFNGIRFLSFLTTVIDLFAISWETDLLSDSPIEKPISKAIGCSIKFP